MDADSTSEMQLTYSALPQCVVLACSGYSAFIFIVFHTIFSDRFCFSIYSSIYCATRLNTPFALHLCFSISCKLWSRGFHLWSLLRRQRPTRTIAKQ